MTKEEAIEILRECVTSGRAITNGCHINDTEYEVLKIAIKALEQQPSDDCVSIAELEKWLDLNFSFGGACRKLELFDRLEKELPRVTPTQRWIPVSERLPDTNETVLCWYEYYHWSLEKVLPEYGLGYYFKEAGAWGGEVANGLKAKVLAWQPLPKPYEEKRDNEND